MPVDLAGKAIIITGASSGIGEATAVACAAAGMDVVINARRADRLESVARRIESLGRRAEIVVGDVAEIATTNELLRVAEKSFGGFHAAFANAGYGLDRHVIRQSNDELRRIFEVNFFASVDLVQEAARHLLQNERTGHLLMCSSCLAKFTLPSYSAYSATKAAQSHVCRAMRIELEPEGIEVSCVHPIATVTEFHEVVGRISRRQPEVSATDHAPRMFVQPAERVARAVVRCLRRPVPEVWTSFIVRSSAALMTLSPRFTDLILRRTARRDGRRRRT